MTAINELCKHKEVQIYKKLKNTGMLTDVYIYNNELKNPIFLVKYDID